MSEFLLNSRPEITRTSRHEFQSMLTRTNTRMMRIRHDPKEKTLCPTSLLFNTFYSRNIKTHNMKQKKRRHYSLLDKSDLYRRRLC